MFEKLLEKLGLRKVPKEEPVQVIRREAPAPIASARPPSGSNVVVMWARRSPQAQRLMTQQQGAGALSVEDQDALEGFNHRDPTRLQEIVVSCNNIPSAVGSCIAATNPNVVLPSQHRQQNQNQQSPSHRPMPNLSARKSSLPGSARQ